MSHLVDGESGSRHLLMGNEAIARGALEAGVSVAAGYPGTPSSEIIETLARTAEARNLYVEWSTNEKIALEVAAAASFAGLRGLAVMKQNGVNVASDFLLHLAGSGTRGGMVLIPCDDPGALSSINEGESRHFARLVEIPLLEPGDFQEAKDMVKWAFELSEELQSIVMLRSVTRLSHASGDVTFGELPEAKPEAAFKCDGFILDPNEGAIISAPVDYRHGQQHAKLKKAEELFETSPFNTYTGPDKPELVVITSSACNLYSKEAINILGVEDRVGLLKLGTTWPIPPKLVGKYLGLTEKVLIVEEVVCFLEDQVKILTAELGSQIGTKLFYGKRDGSLPMVGELNPDHVVTALANILGIEAETVPEDYTKRAQEAGFVGAPNRELTFCPGCPHRASFWSIHNCLELDNRRGLRLRRHRVLYDGRSSRGLQHPEDGARHGLRHRRGQRLRQARPVRHGSAGPVGLRGLDLLSFGHTGPDQRGSPQVGHHHGPPGQQRHRHDRVSVPPGADHGRARGDRAGHRPGSGLPGHRRPGGDRRPL